MRYTHEDHDEIRNLLIGHAVLKVDNNTLLLDDSTLLQLHGNVGGCGGCTSGDYDLTELNDCPVNMITAVEFSECPTFDDEPTGHYRIFVLTHDDRIKLAEFKGSDGNGYYGTGYWIEVERK